jgi:anti-sigma regulatory factor (Ser/Thr protein kinase)
LALDQDTEQDVVFAVNEAASNAIEHAYVAPGPGDLVTVSLWTEPRQLYVELADHYRWQRPDRDPGHRGRGILILQQVVGSASIHKDPDGTRVLLRHPPPGKGHQRGRDLAAADRRQRGLGSGPISVSPGAVSCWS